ncbi:MAG: YceI family protein [Bacteroidetes bacterium]|jgi:polyisoprenoid-binding protein YceI|nr:YceI family protein [Bacteroidota bacterium]|tara:strand:+ start:268 stop:831 length:564 start_codon:yes stop_codon:yes gene_type:complete
MKTKTLLSLLLLTLSSLSFAQSEFNLESSEIQWKGTKITNQSHTGTLKFKKADIKIKNKYDVSGEFKVDMSSLKNDDLSGEWKQKIEGHLKSDDFFSVEKHQEATLVIKKVTSKKNNSYELTGDLTIKSITHPVNFVLLVFNDRIESKLTFNRSKYDIRFASGSFFENLGDNLINDEINLEIILNKI